MLEEIAFGSPFVLLLLPLLGGWFLLLVVLAARDLVLNRRPATSRPSWGLWSAAIMFGTMGLLWFHVPQRIAFGLCCTALRGLVDQAPADEFDGAELDRFVGPYRVERYGSDRRGGVYFCTHTGPDGIGPDRTSYGFAFRPNGQGTPFGNAKYRKHHLFRDWFVFAASDDG
jgi:hypothetical protein